MSHSHNIYKVTGRLDVAPPENGMRGHQMVETVKKRPASAREKIYNHLPDTISLQIRKDIKTLPARAHLGAGVTRERLDAAIAGQIELRVKSQIERDKIGPFRTFETQVVGAEPTPMSKRTACLLLHKYPTLFEVADNEPRKTSKRGK